MRITVQPKDLAILSDGRMFTIRFKTSEVSLSRDALNVLKDLVQYVLSVRNKTNWIYPESESKNLPVMELWPEDKHDLP